jgi:hypothetical protein
MDMKKKFAFTLFVVMASVWAYGCDICGCGAGNNYIGILPDFQKHIVGLRYRANAMLTHVGIGGASTYLTTQEHYNTWEAWSGWNINDRFRLMAAVPYSFNEKTNQGTVRRKTGVGDIVFSGFYRLINKRRSYAGKLLVQSLWVGGGVKLATGVYDPVDKSGSGESANLFQLGTGSYDFNVSAMYDIRLQDAGINLNGGYKINTVNRYGYQYGNKVNGSAQLYYKLRLASKWLFAPNTGIQFEHSEMDRDDNLQVAISNGNLLLGTIGFEGGWGKFAFGANWQLPLTQNLANGIVRAGNRAMLHVAISL